MDWKSKIKHLNSIQEERLELSLYFETADPAPSEFIERIKSQFQYIPYSYFELLSLTDGMQLHWHIFYGSGQSNFESLEEQLNIWPGLNIRYKLPIGKDSSGDGIVLGIDGVGIFSTDGPPVVEYVTGNFETFIGDYLLGQRYPKLFKDKISDDDEWYKMLLDLGWA